MASSLTSPAAIYTAASAIVAARKAIARVTQFATDFSADAVTPGTTMKIPVFTAAETAAEFNPTSNNYENPDGTVTWASVNFKHIKSTFQFNDTDFLLADGTKFWDNAGAASGGAVSAGIEKAVGDLITSAGIEGTHAMASVTKKAVAQIRAKCATIGCDPGRSVVLLEPGYYAELLSLLDSNIYGGAEAVRNGLVPGLFGFKAVAEFGAFPDGGTLGAVIPEDAVAVAARVVPVQSPKVYEEVGVWTDPESGLSLGIRRHGAPKDGSNFMTVEASIGAALIQGAKCFRITAA